MKKLTMGIALLAVCAVVYAAVTASVSWTAPTTNTDGSKITGAITYNLYSGATATALPFTAVVQKGMSNTLTQVMSGLTAGVQTCFAATAVVATIESAQSTPTCYTPAAATLTPSPPGKVTVTP